jgi:WD40 repeat protein
LTTIDDNWKKEPVAGRPERRLDPQDGPVARFALELRALRERAGLPSYRRMAARAHFSHTALSEAAGGSRLPSVEVTLAFVRACDGDVAEWERRWRAVSAELAADESEAEPPEPYVGLVAFEPEDAGRFCGREELVGDLTQRVRSTPLVLVIGPSGSGKSSLVRAGLVAAAAGGRMPGDDAWETALVTPGGQPLRALADAVADSFGAPAEPLHAELRAGHPAALDVAVRQGLAATSRTRALLVVDQFEELFTLCREAAERDRFIAALLDAAIGDGRRTHVVLSMRADFYGHCLEHPALLAVLGGQVSKGAEEVMRQFPVGALTEAQLRQAILEPAARAGLAVEPELVAMLVAQMAGKPGALPLVSHTLRETWRRRSGACLTMADYRATGGVSGALAQTAERLYAEFDPAQQETCRRVLLRLTALGEGTDDTRRRAERAELDALGTPEQTVRVLYQLASARLVVLQDDTAELAHEALIGAWPRLHRWLTDDREALLIHRELTNAAAAWQTLGRDPGTLYRGLRLSRAQEWAAGHAAEMTAAERLFLAEGVALAGREQAAGLRRNRQLRALAAALSVLLLLATGTGLSAWRQRQQAREQQRESVSRQLAAEALAPGTRVDTAATLATRAYRTSPTPEARGAVLSLAGHHAYQLRLAGHAGTVASVAFSPDGRSLASGGWDRTVIVWDAATGARRATLTGHGKPIHAVAFSPDGKRLASGDAGGTIMVWDLARNARIRTIAGLPSGVSGLAFSDDGRRLFGCDTAEHLAVWEVASGRRTRSWGVLEEGVEMELGSLRGFGALRAKAVPVNEQTARVGLSAHEWSSDPEAGGEQAEPEEDVEEFDQDGPEPGYVFARTPNGAYTAFADDVTGALSLDHSYGSKRDTFDLSDHASPVRAVAFAPDGTGFVSADMAGSVYLWDLGRLARTVALTGHLGSVTDVAVSADSRRYAASGEDGTVLVWNGSRTDLVGHTATVDCVTFSGDGRTIVTGSADTDVRVWDAATGRTRRVLTPDGVSPVTSTAMSADGVLLAAAAGHDIHLWNAATGTAVAVLKGHADTINSVAFSPDARLLASGAADGTVALWDAVLRRQVAKFAVGGAVHSVAFSPDGGLVAAAGDNHRITLIASAGGRASAGGASAGGRTVAVLDDHPANLDEVAFSPDGRLLAAAGGDGRVTLWDVIRHERVDVIDGPGPAMLAVAFSPSGRFLAMAGLDRTVQIWDVAGKTRWATLTGHAEGITSVAFSPDGTTLASSSLDNTTILWPMDIAAANETVYALGR